MLTIKYIVFCQMRGIPRTDIRPRCSAGHSADVSQPRSDGRYEPVTLAMDVCMRV